MKTSRHVIRTALLTMAFLCSVLPETLLAATMDHYRIGSHGTGHAVFPAWFKQSLLDFQDDLEDARKSGKRGIIIMFSQENCFHCQAFIETTLRDKSIVQRIRKNYDVIGLDIFSDNEITYIDGTQTTIKNFAETAKARFTPTLLFIGLDNKIMLKIVGLYPPEKFKRVLDYLAGNHYKSLTLREYLQNTRPLQNNAGRKIHYDLSLFEKPPLALNQINKTPLPLLVVFENPNCNPCERFHKRILRHKAVRAAIGKFRSVQLDASDGVQRITTPAGKVTSPRDWASELQLNYEVSVVFFDVQGREVHRIDSEFGKDRFLGSMQYVSEQAYLHNEQFLQWRKQQALRKRAE